MRYINLRYLLTYYYEIRKNKNQRSEYIGHQVTQSTERYNYTNIYSLL